MSPIQHVVGLFESYYFNNILWLYLEFCGGGALDSIMIELEKPLNESQIRYVSHEMCEGLKFLHSSYVIHRDLKAGNVLLTLDGQVKLADFGVSAKTKADHQKRDSFIGTPYWMAPEVIVCETFKDEPYNVLADIWSFGITLIELAECDPPYSDMSPNRVVIKIQKSDPPKLRSPSRWSKDFNDFLGKCLQKKPCDRLSADLLLEHAFCRTATNPKPILDLLSELKAEVIEESVDHVDEDSQSIESAVTPDISSMAESQTESDFINLSREYNNCLVCPTFVNDDQISSEDLNDTISINCNFTNTNELQSNNNLEGSTDQNRDNLMGDDSLEEPTERYYSPNFHSESMTDMEVVDILSHLLDEVLNQELVTTIICNDNAYGDNVDSPYLVKTSTMFPTDDNLLNTDVSIDSEDSDRAASNKISQLTGNSETAQDQMQHCRTNVSHVTGELISKAKEISDRQEENEPAETNDGSNIPLRQFSPSRQDQNDAVDSADAHDSSNNLYNAKITKKTRLYVIDGVQVTSSTYHVMAQGNTYKVKEDFQLRKAELQELKRLQKEEAQQYQNLHLKTQMLRDQQERKFDDDLQVLVRQYDYDLELLNKQNKKHVDEAERANEEEAKLTVKRVKQDQEKEIKAFRELLKQEHKLLKQEIEMLPKGERKDALKHKKEDLDLAHDARERQFLATIQHEQEDIFQRTKESQKQKILLLDAQYLQQKHQKMRGREAAICRLEEKQLHEKHQLAKNQIKELFFLQRSQMLVRHQREIEHVRKLHLRKEEEMVRAQLLERKRLPKILRQEAKTRTMMCRESLRIQKVDSSDLGRKIREFEEQEQKRIQRETKKQEQKHQRRNGHMKAENEAALSELQLMQNEKRTMLVENESLKLKQYDDDYASEMKKWRDQLKPRKQALEDKFNQELAEHQFSTRQMATNGSTGDCSGDIVSMITCTSGHEMG